jgi:hypothetical protein
MPFVRIVLMRDKSIQYRKTIGEIVYNAMRDVIDVPKDDKFQISPNIQSKTSNYRELSGQSLHAALVLKMGPTTALVHRSGTIVRPSHFNGRKKVLRCPSTALMPE